MMIPVVLIPVATFILFIVTWQGGFNTSLDTSQLQILFAIPVAISFLAVFIVLVVRACRNKFFRRFLIMPVLCIPTLSAYSLFVLWQIGLSTDKSITLLLYTVPIFCTVFTLLVILIIWLFKRHVLWLIVHIYLIVGVFVFAFVHYDYERMALHLNIYLYQEGREGVIERLRSDTLSQGERNALIYVDSIRNVPYPVRLNGKEMHLQSQLLKDTGDGYVSEMHVKRNCDGELVADFMYDSDDGSNYYFIYSDALPVKYVDSVWTAGLGTARAEEYYKIEEYEIVETIKPHWYYVKQSNGSGFHLDFSGLFGGGGGWGGGGGGTSGGCQ